MQQRRARRSEAVRNDAAILDAAARTIATGGWDAASMAAVGEAAGLTYGPVYARFPDRTALAIDLWNDRLSAEFGRLVRSLPEALRAGDTAGFGAAWDAAALPTTLTLAAIELMQASRFEPGLAPIWADTKALVSAVVTPSSPRERPARAAAAAALAVSIGLALSVHKPWTRTLVLTAQCSRFERALTSSSNAPALPRQRPRDLLVAPFATGDARIDRALTATVEEVAHAGYHGATIARICRASDVTQGFLYKRYAGKLEIFLDAGAWMIESALDTGERTLGQWNTEYGAAIAEAMLWRELLHPDASARASFGLERNRLARHGAAMASVQATEDRRLLEAQMRAGGMSRAEATAFVHLDLALGIGLSALAVLAPNAWRLPFTGVTAAMAP